MSKRVSPVFVLVAGIVVIVVGSGCSGGVASSGGGGSGNDVVIVGKTDTIRRQDLPIQMAPPTAGSFTQQIDHPRDGSASPGTFQQRYWYSTQFSKGNASAPVLFYLCGEAACDPWYATSMADMAKALDASVVVLEHRYYGTSLPYPDETLAHMKYLTIHNALEDAAGFETWAKTNLPLGGKWIAVGGSYPGMLAAFYREQHPELVAGAWASSAPVNVQLSFWGYDAIASLALGDTCTSLFQTVLDEADAAFDDPSQRDALSMRLFGAPAPAAKADFLQGFSDYAMSAAQYGQTRNLCAALQQEADPMDGFAGFLNPPLVVDPNDPSNNSDGGVAGGPGATGGPLPPMAMIPRLRAPDTSDNFAGNEWFYQVCTEVGFYQIANPDRAHSILSDLTTEDYWAAQCQQYVGTAPAIDATRAELVQPLLDGDVSNVFFVNGSLDPWSSLSFTGGDGVPAGLSTFVVATGSHCEDLDNLQQNSVLGVFEAHQQVYDAMTSWLAPAPAASP
jgi:hypothetical protein